MEENGSHPKVKVPLESRITPHLWFRIIWVVFTTAGLFGGIIAGGISAAVYFFGIGYLYELISPRYSGAAEALFYSSFIVIPILSIMIAGITLGVAQRFCLKDLLTRSWQWVKAYAKGWGSAALVAGLIVFTINWIGSYAIGFYALYIGGFVGGLLGLLIGGISTGIMLRSVLQRQIGQSGSWLKSSLLGWVPSAVISATMVLFLLGPVVDMSPEVAFPWLFEWNIGLINEEIASVLYYPIVGALIIIIAGGVSGTISGIPLAHVLGDRIGFNTLPSLHQWYRVGRVVMYSLFGIIVCGLFVIGLQPCGWLDRGLDVSGCYFQVKGYPNGDHLSFSPDGEFLVTWSSHSGDIHIWQISDRRLSNIIEHRFLSDVRFFPDKNLLVSASKGCHEYPNLCEYGDGEVKLWQIQEGTLLQELAEERVYSMDISPDGRRLVVGTGDGFVRLLDILTGGSTSLLQHTDPVTSVAFSSDGKLIASASKDMIMLWQVERQSIVYTIKDLTELNSIAFSPQEPVLASGSGDGTVHIRRVSDGEIVMELNGHAESVEDLAFSSDGNLLVTCSDDNSVKVWRMSDGSLEREYRDSVGVAFSPDGTILAISDKGDRVVRLYRLK